ncbi:MAG TPA: cytochrome o ubiquinol oxidase subunit IV [Chlamydiales bacterium]|nr:cytochrome o ubiquinol oxidase subunit IV [Chlamydiales bacterium]
MKESWNKHLEWAEIGTYKSYFSGFFISVLFAALSYVAVLKHLFSKNALISIVVIFATVQMIVQFIFFLHLGKEEKPRWNVMAFLFMLLIVAIVVIGSLWIMANLDYRMMTEMDMKQMAEHEGI